MRVSTLLGRIEQRVLREPLTLHEALRLEDQESRAPDGRRRLRAEAALVVAAKRLGWVWARATRPPRELLDEWERVERPTPEQRAHVARLARWRAEEDEK